MDTCDVAIVGAGPVGLSLALGLARAGCTVTVLEKKGATSEHSRAPAIWPRTQEVLDGLGVIDRFLERGIALEVLQLIDADRDRELLRLPMAELAGETEHPRLLILPQDQTERLLCEAVRAQPDAELAFSTEVCDLFDDGRGVIVQARRGDTPVAVRARLAIGCDGAHSRVRDVLGADFPGQTYPVRAALADVRFPGSGVDLPFPRLSVRDTIAVGLRIDRDLWRLILPLTGAPMLLEHRVDQAVARLLGRSDHAIVWMSEFRLHRRLSTHFCRGRIALAGDAAHLNSPVGGQGMNAGIQDAALLCDAAVETLERDDTAPLERYARTRRRQIERGVNRFTNALTTALLGAGGHLFRPTFRAAALATHSAHLRHRLLRRLAMLDA